MGLENQFLVCKANPQAFKHMNPLSRNPGSAPEDDINILAFLSAIGLKDEI